MQKDKATEEKEDGVRWHADTNLYLCNLSNQLVYGVQWLWTHQMDTSKQEDTSKREPSSIGRQSRCRSELRAASTLPHTYLNRGRSFLNHGSL